MRSLVSVVASLALAGCGLADRQAVTTLRANQDQFAITDGVYFLTIPGTFIDPDPLTEQEVSVNFTPFFNPTVEDTDVAVWAVRQTDDTWLALWGKDAFSGCDVSFQLVDSVFVDPCSGSVYDLAGQLLRGPSVRDLGAFATTFTPEGKLQIDTGHYTSGRDR